MYGKSSIWAELTISEATDCGELIDEQLGRSLSGTYRTYNILSERADCQAGCNSATGEESRAGSPSVLRGILRVIIPSAGVSQYGTRTRGLAASLDTIRLPLKH